METKTKKVKLQELRRQFEILIMDEGETVAEYLDKVQELVNKMRACKDAISYEYIVDKILRTLTPRFDHVVVAIEEARNLETMEIEELLHSLEAHEYHINERKQCQEQALQARSQFKGKKGFKKGGKGNRKCKDSQDHQGEESSESGKKGERAKNKPKKRANLAQEEESDSEEVMLMAKTEDDSSENAVWYLDSGCSTHMTGRKE
ncbi:uncharacterized protein LOC108330347 [Vigna angularis]|uniref:uncharacterized protein LOC108330347 n=1 Tax=Phaseolus angularis TaxID=3914 RepID=UPI00080A3136|nr:uncharacterized protein LOC108330347 [Vigna angularis]